MEYGTAIKMVQEEIATRVIALTDAQAGDWARAFKLTTPEIAQQVLQELVDNPDKGLKRPLFLAALRERNRGNGTSRHTDPVVLFWLVDGLGHRDAFYHPNGQAPRPDEVEALAEKARQRACLVYKHPYDIEYAQAGHGV
jgi:hypothetical protein